MMSFSSYRLTTDAFGKYHRKTVLSNNRCCLLVRRMNEFFDQPLAPVEELEIRLNYI